MMVQEVKKKTVENNLKHLFSSIYLTWLKANNFSSISSSLPTEVRIFELGRYFETGIFEFSKMI